MTNERKIKFYTTLLTYYLLFYGALHLLAMIFFFGFERGWGGFAYFLLFWLHLPFLLIGGFLTFLGRKLKIGLSGFLPSFVSFCQMAGGFIIVNMPAQSYSGGLQRSFQLWPPSNSFDSQNKEFICYEKKASHSFFTPLNCGIIMGYNKGESMGRMMPGRVRQEGIDLYDAGKLSVDKIEGSHLLLTIDGEQFRYSATDEEISCSCSLFTQRNYCQHLAAAEYFLKNDEEGRQLEQALTDNESHRVEVERRTYAGGIFLDKLLALQDSPVVKYSLSVEGQLLLFDQNIDWTLKINRLPDQRSYIIRDVAVFLKTVRKQGFYQIGKSYYEQLSLSAFDEASQDLISFLWQLVPESSVLETDVLSHFGRHLRLPLSAFEVGVDLLQDLTEFSWTYDEEVYTELTIQPLQAQAGLFQFAVTVDKELLTLTIREEEKRSLFHGHYFCKGSTLYHVQAGQHAVLKTIKDVASFEKGVKVIQIELGDKDRLALALLSFADLGPLKAPDYFKVRDFKTYFDFSLLVDGRVGLQLRLQSHGYKIASQADLEALPFLLHRLRLSAIEEVISGAGFHGRFQAKRAPLSDEEKYTFFTQILPQFRRIGEVNLSSELAELFVDTKPQIRVNTTGSLLEVSFDFDGIAPEEVNQALQSLLNDATHFTSQTGKVVVFDEETKRISQTLAFLRGQGNGQGALTFGRFVTQQLAQLFAGDERVEFSRTFQEMAYDLAHPESYVLSELPIKATLRDYQELGVKWLSTLDKYGFGGVLADDMGLGKTLQTIAFLAGKLEEQSKVLILAPSSLIYNWQEECHKFAPQLDVAVIYGNKAARVAQLAQGAQVVITSYSSFRQDIEAYQGQFFDYLILDEAQVMKNAQTKIAQHLRDFEVGNCFALSGTPIENHLNEIWSIFQIVLPGLLPVKTEFNKMSPKDVARTIRPFVLRRRKEDVLEELPDLIEINVLNELSDEQKAIYLAQLRQMQVQIASESDAAINRKKIEILAGITRLRQICDTPKLFLEDYTGQSGKLESLRELLVQLKEGDHRVLIFSQFRSMLDIVETELEELGLSSYKLTGSTPSHLRQEMTTAFNMGSRDAFLISLKAGGVGLNLTGADTVILIDLWWNPAVEAQAISRAHRMGQTKAVEFYRLITRGTIEEKIQELQESKKNLVTTVLDGNESRASMTVEEIKEILGVS